MDFLYPRFVLGTLDDDRLLGSRRDDIGIGLGGDDFIDLGDGPDALFGGDGNDLLIGGRGDDVVQGEAGNDELNGRSGDDFLIGGSGNDMIIGARGDDILRGGSGMDGFAFDPSRRGEGTDNVRDFSLGEDKIVLNAADVIDATPGLVDFILANGGDSAAVLAGLDAADGWSLSSDVRGNLTIDHPNGTIVLVGIPGDAADSFVDLAGALSVQGLGAALSDVAEPALNPASVGALVAASGGVADDDSSDFDLLGIALEAAGLTGALSDADASLSVFAPTDAAFVSLAQRLGFGGNDEAGALDAILAALTDLGGGDPIPLLTDVLTFHVAPEARTLGELQLDMSIPTLFADADLLIDGDMVEDQDPDFDDASIIASDVQTGNGVVQVIDEVLLPFDV